MQSLGTKKSRNLSGLKNHATSWAKKSHATSQDKKKSLFQQVHKALNCSKWHQFCSNRSKNRTKWIQIGPNFSKRSKWDKQVIIGPNGFKWVHRGPKQGSQIGVQNIMNSIGWPLNPGLLGLVYLIETRQEIVLLTYLSLL